MIQETIKPKIYISIDYQGVSYVSDSFTNFDDALFFIENEQEVCRL